MSGPAMPPAWLRMSGGHAHPLMERRSGIREYPPAPNTLTLPSP
jgi:hypothetical protein